MPQLMGYILACVFVAAVIGMALLFYKLGMPKKYTRKMVHILVGFEWVILSHFMGATFHFLIVCLVFTAGLTLSFFLKLLPAMSSDGENDPGTVYYGVSMCILSLVCLFIPEMMLPFGIGVFCTSFGDGLAGIAGQLVSRYNPKIFRKKTLVGTLVNFAVSFGVALVFRAIFDMELSVWGCLFIGILSAGLELVGTYGLDNIYVSVGVAFFAYALMYIDGTLRFVVPILVTPFLIATVLHKKALTPYGLVGAMFLDAIVSVVFMNFGFIVLISFFVGSLLVDKIKKIKKREDTITKKEGTRDLVQVIANGLAPMLMAVMFALTVEYAFLIAFVASLAEAFADTAASGIGVFSKKTFDPFKMKKCESGLSGGMSLVGTIASLVAAFLISLIPWAFGVYGTILEPVIVTASAFLGVVFDSFLGSLLQIKYRCTVCGKITEREAHCDKPTVKDSGFAFFDNDVVNLASGIFTAIVAAVTCFVIA
ncbi:MAG: DUF92 domain-containing protein [Clostridia bacterium]|nr:DUF92 domain-containing protein [Clostridia bacterium]